MYEGNPDRFMHHIEKEKLYPHVVEVGHTKMFELTPKEWAYRGGEPPIPLKWCNENFGVTSWLASYGQTCIELRFKEATHAVEFKLKWGDY